MRRPSALVLLLPLLATLGPGGLSPLGSHGSHRASFDFDLDDDEDDEDERAEEEQKRELRARGLRAETPSMQSESQTWWLRQRAYPGAEIPRGAYVRAHAAWNKLPRVGPPALAPGASNNKPPRGGSSGGPGHTPPPPGPEGPPDGQTAGAWLPIGPAPVETTVGDLVTPNMSPSAGRASAVVVDPTDASIVYAGYSMGGVWKSTDGGSSWKPMSDMLPSLAVGSIALDPNNSAIVYVGTGEAAFYPGYAGRGVYRSTDGGQSWNKFGGDQFDGLSVSRLFVDIDGSVYVTTAFGASGAGNVCTNSGFDAPGQGLFRTTNDGASWDLLKSGKMVDVEIDTSVTPRTILVSDFATGVSRSIDGGDVWTSPTGLPTAGSNPKARNIQLTFSAADPSIVFAGLGVGTASTVFISTDHGASFAEMAGAPDYCRSQCYYDNSILADPTDPNIVYVGGALCGIWKTDDALSAAPSWVNVSMPGFDCGNFDANWYLGYVHPDVHGLAVDPTDPARVFAATDGGIAFSSNHGNTWEQRNDGVATLQFYGICVHPTDANILYGGTQDNGSMRRVDDKPLWHGLISGDGGPCAIDPLDPKIMLLSGEGATLFRSKDGFDKNISYVFNAEPGSCQPSQKGCGDRPGFIAPLIGDPMTPGTFYVGTHRLWKNSGGGIAASWEPISADLTAGKGKVNCPNAASFPKFDDTLTAIAVARSAPSTLYTGSAAGVVSASTNGGGAWSTVSKPPLPGRYVTGLAVDPRDDKIVYVSFSGFDAATPNEPGHVFRSTNAGETWESATTIDLPVNSLATHPIGQGLVYAGTDLGVMVSTDGGASWSALGADLPSVAVFSLKWSSALPGLFAGTHGRSAWQLPMGPVGASVEPRSLDFEVVKGAKDPAPQTFGALAQSPFGSIASFDIVSDADWITVAPGTAEIAGGQPFAISVQVAAAKKPLGEHKGNIVLKSKTGAVDVTIPVTLQVNEAKKKEEEDTGCGCRLDRGRSEPAWGAIGLAGLAAIASARRARGRSRHARRRSC